MNPSTVRIKQFFIQQKFYVWFFSIYAYIVIISSNTQEKTFVGIYLFAQDSNGINVDGWTSTDSLVESTSCNGLMHKTKTKKTNIEAVWYPSSNVAGDITIKYLTNIY